METVTDIVLSLSHREGRLLGGMRDYADPISFARIVIGVHSVMALPSHEP
jgi:hypothetical protein